MKHDLSYIEGKNTTGLRLLTPTVSARDVLATTYHFSMRGRATFQFYFRMILRDIHEQMERRTGILKVQVQISLESTFFS